ncbi:MAG TPA: penicillin-binding transpeptidase domain-containing protein [Candidatus Dormibacteraeota bacterium]|nr:penicillin-binding transpeptidase domain-containing protein [Candidatus Dormibacteraeota bacterium]
MDSLKIASVLALAAALLAPPSLHPAQSHPAAASNSPAPPKSLFAQSAAQLLAREFPNPDISFLLFDARSGALLSSRWDDPQKPISLGSLVKPFTALAYAAQHNYQFPVHVCRGEASGCWQVRPHGPLTLISAIAYSCNSYFRALAATLTGEQILLIAQQFGIEPPAADLTGPPLMGLGDQWRISPLHMAHAYLELIRRRDQPAVREILTGMAQAAGYGTGSAVGHVLNHSDALVKTGTAPCTHARPAPGDGFTIALVPAAQPELLLMVRVHSVPGAIASATAARMLARLQQQ